MKLKSLVLAASLLATGSTFAATYDIDLQGSSNLWSAVVGATHTSSGAFSDTYTFSNYSAASGTVTANLISTGVSFNSITLNGTSGLTGNLGLFNLAAILGQNTTGPLTLVVTGNVLGSVGSYGGDFNVTTAVPEPATYGMLLGGMGVLGFLARRRKQK